MRGVLENGEVVRNKREAIERAVFYLEDSGQDWVYVMRYDNPEYVWFTVGYVDRPNIKNHVKLRPDMTSDKLKKLYAWRERVCPHRELEQEGERMSDRVIVRATGREIVTDSNGIPITGQNIKMFKTPQYATPPKCEEGVDEDTDRIMVNIMRIKADGCHWEQFVPLEKFKEMMKE